MEAELELMKLTRLECLSRVEDPDGDGRDGDEGRDAEWDEGRERDG